jgi:copper transport protein
VFTSIWLGGVAMLALVVAPALLASREQLNQLGIVIARFSPWAMFSVLAIALTGIAQSAGFVGSFDALFSTAYGRALLVKIALFAVLILFGVFHQQVIAPRLQAWRRDDEAASQAGRRFRVAILAELGVSVALFAAVGALVSLPLSRDVAADAAAVTVQTQSTDNVVVTLGMTPAIPNQFVLRLNDADGNPITAVEQAVLRFKSLSMDMGESEVALTPYGSGYFVGQGRWLSMSGAWDVSAIVRRPGMSDIRSSFTIDVP